MVRRWFWRRPAGLLSPNRMRPLTWPSMTSRRDRADFALVIAGTVADFRSHADAQIVREYFRHLDLDLERAEIDHGEDRRIGGDVGALLHDQLADLAVDRRAHLEFLDLALQVLGEQALTIEGQMLALQFESQAFDIEFHVGFGIGDRDVGLGQRVLGAQQIHLRHGAGIVGTLGALDFALGRLPIDHGLIEQLLGRQLLLAMIEAGALHVDFEALACRLFLFSRLLSSGLTISASTWSLATLSPALTSRVTVPGLAAYRVGLTAATTLPCTETSRVRVPRLTSAMRSRLMLADESDENSRAAVGTIRASTAMRNGSRYSDLQPAFAVPWLDS